ncbi:MAG TPA: NAD-dependent epimerase/dehydratase family protein [Aestuariivirgaceae bacterium]|nr:NAD-dependent epimerase/dehydratase family protein [Aestuariivirgaceae bacterium]
MHSAAELQAEERHSTTGPLIALTGATGFIGRHVLRELPKRGYRFRVLLRRPVDIPLECASAVIGDLARPQNLSAALAGVDAVVHSAGVSQGVSGLPDADHRILNAEATYHLARAAQAARVKRFVFLSSIRAQTGPTAEGTLTEDRPATPTDAYGRAKLEAERRLGELDIDWVALRPVLVYGKGMQGNFAALVRLARSPYPLPFGSLKARRSLLSVDNLVDAVAAAVTAPSPLRRPFIVADREALTVAQMICAMRRGLGRSANLVPVPAPLLKLALHAAGRTGWYPRLACPLIADASQLSGLGWAPQVSTEAGLSALMSS